VIQKQKRFENDLFLAPIVVEILFFFAAKKEKIATDSGK
jgi:hypothetical protein